MRLSIILLGLLSSLAIAAPIARPGGWEDAVPEGVSGDSPLASKEPKKVTGSSEAGGKNSSASDAAAASDDTSSASTSACGLISCASSAGTSGPDSSSSSAASSGGITIEPDVDPELSL